MRVQNTIICLTSNLGSDILLEPSSTTPAGQVTPEAYEQVISRVAETFPPELINRLDSQIVFNKLSRESIVAVVGLRLNDVAERVKDRRITLEVSDSAKEWLADEGWSDIYGARAVARVVRTKLMFPLAKKLLAGTIRDGDVVNIHHQPGSNELTIQDNHPTTTDTGGADKKTPPLRLTEDDDFDEGFFFSSRSPA
ncbi:chaperone ATPase hsp78 [Serendipita sp. 407]|nr:chaperone ATPase hsp78 [Serendipita sp. 407]